MHYGFNEGALAQAYCLSKIIEKEFPSSKAEIIDRRYPKKIAVYGNPLNGRTRAIQDAINNWLPVTKKKFFGKDDKKCLEYINSQGNGMIVGSDQIWDLKYKRRLRRLLGKGIMPRQSYGFYPAFPNLYWPDKNVKIPKFSYAASIGKLDFNSIPKSHLKKMNETLSQFELLSVRDDRSLNLLELINSKIADKTEIIPDPTLSFNMVDKDNDENLKNKLSNLGFDFNRKRVGFISGNFKNARILSEKLKTKNVQTICITTNNDYCDLNISSESFHPLEWVRIFNYLDACMTDRMHAMIFCLRNETPFVAIDQNTTAYESKTKIVSLLSRLNLMEWYRPQEKLVAEESFFMLNSLLEDNWNWSTINQKLDDYGEVGLKYMRKIASLY